MKVYQLTYYNGYPWLGKLFPLMFHYQTVNFSTLTFRLKASPSFHKWSICIHFEWCNEDLTAHLLLKTLLLKQPRFSQCALNLSQIIFLITIIFLIHLVDCEKMLFTSHNLTAVRNIKNPAPKKIIKKNWRLLHLLMSFKPQRTSVALHVGTLMFTGQLTERFINTLD